MPLEKPYLWKINLGEDGEFAKKPYCAHFCRRSKRAAPDADGSNQKNLLGDLTGRVTVGLGTVTSDGRYIVYYSDLNGGVRHIWRMDIIGSSASTGRATAKTWPACEDCGRRTLF